MKTVVLFIILVAQFRYCSSQLSCERVAETTFECTLTEIVIGTIVIKYKTEDKRMPLSGRQSSVTIHCGENEKPFSFSGNFANQIRVTYVSDKAQVTAHFCDSLEGPTAAGQKCSVSSSTHSCHGEDGSSCIYKTVTSTTIQGQGSGGNVDHDIAEHIKGKVDQHRKLQTVKFGGESYIVVQPGVRYCVNVDAVSVKNDIAPTGYEWGCLQPHYSKKDYNSSCTTFTKCDSSVCPTPPPPPLPQPTSAAMTVCFILNVLFVALAPLLYNLT